MNTFVKSALLSILITGSAWAGPKVPVPDFFITEVVVQFQETPVVATEIGPLPSPFPVSARFVKMTSSRSALYVLKYPIPQAKLLELKASLSSKPGIERVVVVEKRGV